MPDLLRHVHAGEPLAIDADTWNALVDAARAYRAGHAGTPSAQPFRSPLAAALHCLVKYDASSGSVLPAFSVLRIADTLTDVDADPHAHQGRPAYLGAAPAAGGQVVVTVEPIRGGKIGRAVLTGHVAVTLAVSDTGHTRAVPIANDTTKLASAALGGYPVVWKETGTGDVWAVVLLGPSADGRPLAGILTEASGAASGSFMRLDGSGEWEPTGGGITNAIYPTRLDVSTAATGPGVYATFTPKAKAFGLLWESHPGAGRYGFLPIQAAEYGYAGFVSTGAQSFSGEKTFRGPVNCNADFDAITTGGTYLSAATAGLRVKALVGGDLRVTMGYSAGAPDISPAYYLQVNGGAYFNGQVGADGAVLAGGEVVSGSQFRLDGSGYGGTWGDGSISLSGSGGGAAKLYYISTTGGRQVWGFGPSSGGGTPVRFEVGEQLAATYVDVGNNIISPLYRTYDEHGGSAGGGTYSQTVGGITTYYFRNGLYVGGTILTPDGLPDELDGLGGIDVTLGP